MAEQTSVATSQSNNSLDAVVPPLEEVSDSATEEREVTEKGGEEAKLKTTDLLQPVEGLQNGRVENSNRANSGNRLSDELRSQLSNSKNGQVQFNPYLPNSGAASVAGSSSPQYNSSRLSLRDENSSQALNNLKNISANNSNNINNNFRSSGSNLDKKAATVTAASLGNSKRAPSNGSGMILIGSRLPSVATPSLPTNSSVSSSRAKPESEHLQKLSILKDLMDQGYLSVEEYSQRKSQIIDQITGTAGSGTAGPNRKLNKGML